MAKSGVSFYYLSSFMASFSVDLTVDRNLVIGQLANIIKLLPNDLEDNLELQLNAYQNDQILGPVWITLTNNSVIIWTHLAIYEQLIELIQTTSNNKITVKKLNLERY